MVECRNRVTWGSVVVTFLLLADFRLAYDTDNLTWLAKIDIIKFDGVTWMAFLHCAFSHCRFFYWVKSVAVFVFRDSGFDIAFCCCNINWATWARNFLYTGLRKGILWNFFRVSSDRCSVSQMHVARWDESFESVPSPVHRNI